MKKLTLILIALTLTGCARTQLLHSNKGAAEFNQDKYQCDQEANQYAASIGARGNFLIANERSTECMKLKFGWFEKVASNT